MCGQSRNIENVRQQAKALNDEIKFLLITPNCEEQQSFNHFVKTLQMPFVKINKQTNKKQSVKNLNEMEIGNKCRKINKKN